MIIFRAIAGQNTMNTLYTQCEGKVKETDLGIKNISYCESAIFSVSHLDTSRIRSNLQKRIMDDSKVFFLGVGADSLSESKTLHPRHNMRSLKHL
jgi:hypothetical protein